MDVLVEVSNLVKSYGKKEVLHGIDFNIYEGEILCFLGPNGAAKSTTINILCGVLSYNSGQILYENEVVTHNIKEFKKNLGVVPQDISIYEDLSAEKNVRFFASLYGLRGQELSDGVDFALSIVGLLEHRSVKAKTFSGGMKRRLNIACAIAHKPKLLVMDEPTVGIDPQSRNHILKSILEMKQQGMTILYTTHYMEEVEEISDRILIIDHGKIIAEGTSSSLKAMSKNRSVVIGYEGSSSNFDELYRIEGVVELHHDMNSLQITTVKGIENLDYMIDFLVKENLKIQNITIESDSLETVFLDLTGRSLRD